MRGTTGGAISLQGDEVVLDVSEVIDAVKERLVARGLTVVENLPIPEVDKQIVLLEAPGLRQARTIYAFANPIAKWLLPLVAALYFAAFLLWRRRPPMAVAIGILLVANTLVMALVLSIGRQLFVNELAGTVFGPASTVFYDTLLAYLERGWQVLLWVGLFLVAAGWFAGSNRSGTAFRTTVAGALENAGAAVSDGPVGDAGRWVRANAGWVRVAVGVLGVLVLLWGNDVSLSRGCSGRRCLVVALLAAVQVLVGAGGGGGRIPPPSTPAADGREARPPRLSRSPWRRAARPRSRPSWTGSRGWRRSMR